MSSSASGTATAEAIRQRGHCLGQNLDGASRKDVLARAHDLTGKLISLDAKSGAAPACPRREL
jgi:hypothetical protein